MADPDSQEAQPTGQGGPEAYFRLRFEKFSGFVEQCSSSISLAGMFLRTRQPKPIGTRIGFELKLADGFRLLRGVGEVAWVVAETAGRAHPPGMGIRFLTLDESGRELIQRIVDEHVKGGGEAFAIERPPASAETGEVRPQFDVSEDPTLLVGRALLPVPDEGDDVEGERPRNRLGAPWGEQLPDLPPDMLDGAAEAPVDEAPPPVNTGDGGEISFDLALEAADEVTEVPGFAVPAPALEEPEEPLPDFDFADAEPEPPVPAPSPRTLEQELAELRTRLAQEVAAPVEPSQPVAIQPWEIPPAAKPSPVAATVPEVPLAPMLPPAQSSAELAGSIDSWNQAAAEEDEDEDVVAPPPRRRSSLLVALLLLLLAAAAAYVFRRPLLEITGLGGGTAERATASPASMPVAEAPSPALVVPEESGPEPNATTSLADELAPEHIAVGPEADTTVVGIPDAEAPTPPAVATVPPAPPAVVAAPPEVPAVAATRITSITWRKTEAGTEILLQANGRLDAGRYSHARLASPERELVKVQGIASPYGTRQLAVGTDELRQVRVGFHERAGGAELHVVLDLTTRAVELRDIRNLGDRLELVLR